MLTGLLAVLVSHTACGGCQAGDGRAAKVCVHHPLSLQAHLLYNTHMLKVLYTTHVARLDHR